MSLIEEILIINFIINVVKKLFSGFKYMTPFLFFIIGGYIFYILFSFGHYIESKIPSDNLALRETIKYGRYKSENEEHSNSVLRNSFASSATVLLNVAMNARNIISFSQIVVQPFPTNSVRMTTLLSNIKDVQRLYAKNNNITYNEIKIQLKTLDTTAARKWRENKAKMIKEILANKKNQIISIYSEDKFFPLIREDREQKKVMNNLLKQYKNLRLKKVENLPIEKGTYMIFKVKEYLFLTRYYVFLVDCGQDDQLTQFKSYINMKYEKVSKINDIQDIDLREAVRISEYMY